MSSYVLGFQEIDRSAISLVGGKGANLGEMAGIDGIHVPDGFCVSTEAYARILREVPTIDDLLGRLSRLKVGDREPIRELSAEIRGVIEGVTIPEDIVEAIARHLHEHVAYAVRSSATAEDLPTASFAGQQDTYLNITGLRSVLQHVSRCWASLFTERAVAYRIQNGFDHRKVQLAVVVQRMVDAEVSGVLFTADPITSNRKVTSIDAVFGLGEALVAGRVNPHVYKVHDGAVVERTDRGERQALTDEQIVRLERIGRRLEAHFGCPQDVEWCLADGVFQIVQSRPITTLFPIPEAGDQENRVYISVGHQQMMTDAFKPLGMSLWQMTTPRPMAIAGSRLFVDVTDNLASPAGRHVLVYVLGKSDPLIRDALTTVLAREGFIKEQPPSDVPPARPPVNFQALVDYEPSIVDALITNFQASLEETKRDIQAQSGPEVFDFIREDVQRLRRLMSNPDSVGVIMTAMNAATWLNDKMLEWLGEKNVADTLTQSVPHNVTSEMGLALMEVADVVRRYPDVVAYLQRAEDDGFLEGVESLEARAALEGYLAKYGMRCVGEIDVTRARWREKPRTLVPMILGNIKRFEPGASGRKFEQGRQEAASKERALLERLKQLPVGEEKARETKRMIDLVRNLAGYREYPKYAMMNRYFVYRQALLKEAERLEQAGVIRDREDVYYLSFDELNEAVRTHQVDARLIDARRAEYMRHEKLATPRVLTSDGEVVTGTHKRDDLPVGAIVGLPVSSGVVEGRARVVLNLEDAALEEGDILVTRFTDPSWTPLFVAIKGLVTEVGGLMTHGAVIAREYGLPAVVGVENATKLLEDGQRIRVDGAAGFIEIL